MARDALVVAGRVDHRADVVQVRRQLLDALADVGVVLVERGVAEQVGGHEGAGGAELACGPWPGRRRSRAAASPCCWAWRTGRRQLAVGREAHVVELDLVEAPPDRFLAEGDVVGPHLFAERVHPGQLLVVDPGLAGPGVDDRQVRPGVGQDVVLEGHDAGDRVDAAGLEIGHQPVEVAQRGRALGADGQRLRHLGLVEDPAAVALDVDDHRVQLGAGGEVQHARCGCPGRPRRSR